MTRLPLLLASLLVLSPLAGATGHLVNVGVGSTQVGVGANVFGGSGDTLDVGFRNTQCSDEADVVDVGLFNWEGACGPEARCEHAEGRDPLPQVATPIGESGGESSPARCTDDDDTVDVGVHNHEGRGTHACDPFTCHDPAQSDSGDATDVGVMNTEVGDADDGNDVGVSNCEFDDRRDATDVGVGNAEFEDQSDTFDLSLFNQENSDTGDVNGLDVGSPGGIPCTNLAAGHGILDAILDG